MSDTPRRVTDTLDEQHRKNLYRRHAHLSDGGCYSQKNSSSETKPETKK